MGAFTNLFEGISRATYEAWLAEEQGNPANQHFIRCLATDETGRYHDPDTEAFWKAEQEAEKLRTPSSKAVLEDNSSF